MTHETVVEELQAQRDFLLANKWVKWSPRTDGEGCLVGRQDGVDLLQDSRWLSKTASWIVVRVIRTNVRINVADGDALSACGWWNDNRCRSAGEAIAVLDEAIRLAKQDMA